MKQASPATVSRGGVIYLNGNDIGWEPFVETWIEKREDKNERGILTEFFGRYMEKSLEYIGRNFKHIVPLVDINMVSTVCYILEGLLPEVKAAKSLKPAVEDEELKISVILQLI